MNIRDKGSEDVKTELLNMSGSINEILGRFNEMCGGRQTVTQTSSGWMHNHDSVIKHVIHEHEQFKEFSKESLPERMLLCQTCAFKFLHYNGATRDLVLKLESSRNHVSHYATYQEGVIVFQSAKTGRLWGSVDGLIKQELMVPEQVKPRLRKIRPSDQTVFYGGMRTAPALNRQRGVTPPEEVPYRTQLTSDVFQQDRIDVALMEPNPEEFLRQTFRLLAQAVVAEIENIGGINNFNSTNLNDLWQAERAELNEQLDQRRLVHPEGSTVSYAAWPRVVDEFAQVPDLTAEQVREMREAFATISRTVADEEEVSF